MLVRCTHCYTPFTLSQEGVVTALDEVEAKGFKFYNAYCPRCGRPNMVAKSQLEREVPGWAPRQVAMQPVVSPQAGDPKPTPARAQKTTKPAAKPKAAAVKKKKAAPPKKKAPAKKSGAKKAPSKAKATKAKSLAKKKSAPKKKKK